MTYTGDLHEGKKHGKGVCIWKNGNRYEGYFVNNKREGHGVFTWA